MNSTIAPKEHVLLVDDEPEILIALEDLLSDRFVVLTAPSAELALDLMRGPADIAVVLTDQRMPEMTGDELVARLSEDYPAQKIMVTGYADIGAVARAVNEGSIFAYVTKPWDGNDLLAKVTKAAAKFRLRQDLATQKQLLTDLMDNSPDGIYFKDRELRFTRANKPMAASLGTTVDSLVGQHLHDVAGPEAGANGVEAEESASLRGEGPILDTIRQQQIGGTTRWLSERKALILGPGGSAVGLVGISRDITQERQLEEQFLQSQKMEAAGRLAGGVAHDFNNLLVVIRGYGELVQSEFSSAEPQYKPLAELLKAADRAAALTKQLLLFSRAGTFRATLLNLNEVVAGVVAMIGRLLHENIRVNVATYSHPLMIMGDATQIEQVILNLAINSRDAMTGGGQISISTELRNGDYVCLRVKDSGEGMSPDVQARIFEPFFTTKEVGKGTGLGLSTVYGIVQKMGGRITVDSELGVGTTFEVLLKRAENQDGPVKERLRHATAPRGTGTILLMEDDEAVRSLARRILNRGGHTVIDSTARVRAPTPWWRSKSSRISLLALGSATAGLPRASRFV